MRPQRLWRHPVLSLLVLVLSAGAGLLGTAAPTQASALPAELKWVSSSGITTFDFGTVDAGQGQSVSATLTLQNVGGRAPGVISVAVSGASSFAITDDTCTGRSRGPGRRCTVTVTYQPEADVGPELASLTAWSKKAARTSIGLAGRSALVPGPTPGPGPSLAIDPAVHPCDNGAPRCWGAVVGTGLMPGTMVVPLYVDGSLVQLYDVPASGTIDELLSFDCNREFSMYATAQTASGSHIGSATVTTPCLPTGP